MSTPAASGTLRIDCRGTSAPVAIQRLESIIGRLQSGARAVSARVDDRSVADAVLAWAAGGQAPAELVQGPTGLEVQIYLLPPEFGGTLRETTAARPGGGTGRGRARQKADRA
jgi:hypothetical protein